MVILKLGVVEYNGWYSSFCKDTTIFEHVSIHRRRSKDTGIENLSYMHGKIIPGL